MLNRRLVRLARRLIPRFAVDQINPFDPFMRDAVRRFAHRLPDCSLVLDAGAGEGQYRPYFEQARHRYIGIDLGVGEPDWEYQGVDTLANTEDLPFPPGTFDGVMSIAVLEHSPYPRKVVHQLNRVLRPGGQLLIVVPTMWEEHQMPNDFYRFTRFGIERLLSEAGFEVQERHAIGGYFWFMGRKSIDLLEFFERFPRLLLWPLLALPFGIVVPLICRYLDWLDDDKYYTIGQLCIARKLGAPGQPEGEEILP